MSNEYLTLVAAIIAAVTSILSLLLNFKLALKRDKRMARWEKEIERLHTLEERLGKVREIVLRYSGVKELNEDYFPLHADLKYLAGQYQRYPELSKSIRKFVHMCDNIVSKEMRYEDANESRSDVDHAYVEIIEQCDKILDPAPWYKRVFHKEKA